MGGYDIFKTVKDENGKWSFPKNLGYPVNSVSDDIFFVANPEGTAGYFSSNRDGGFGASDIYKTEFPDVFTENLLLKGRVVSDTTNMPLKATITIVDYDTKELQGIYRTNGTTGKFIMVLLPKRHYKLIVEADGYHSYIDDIDMTEKLRVQDLFKNIRMKDIANENSNGLMQIYQKYAIDSGLQRISEVSAYKSDSLVRRAKALNVANAETELQVYMNSIEIDKLGLSSGATVNVAQGTASSIVKIVIDDSVSENCVLILGGTELASNLGASFGVVEVTAV